MELLKPNRSVPGYGPGPAASLCRPGGPLLNGSGTGNLSCEPPRIRGAGTRGGCLPEPRPRAPSHCTPQHSQRPPLLPQTPTLSLHSTPSVPKQLPRRMCPPQLIRLHCSFTLPGQSTFTPWSPDHPQSSWSPPTHSRLLDRDGGNTGTSSGQSSQVSPFLLQPVHRATVEKERKEGRQDWGKEGAWLGKGHSEDPNGKLAL